MTTKTYLCSMTVSDIFSRLANAFSIHRDELDGNQYRNYQHIEDSIMNVILQHHIIPDSAYLPLVRELVSVILSEPMLYAEWTEDDCEFFKDQLAFDFEEDDEDEEFPF